MYKTDLVVDDKEYCAVAKRRAHEQERKQRIFNAKYRTIGVDVEALEQQVQDRKSAETRDALRDERFHADSVKHDKTSVLLENRLNEERRRINQAELEFRSLHQRPEDRREWDLYDPEAKLKDKPARVSDADPRCGVSSLQKFEGEDLNNKARQKFQQEQLREAVAQQQRLLDQTKENQKKADYIYDLKAKELDERAVQLAKAEEECRKAINIATKDFNNALRREQDYRESLKKQRNQDDDNTELANHIYSDILTENPAQAASLWGPHRVVTDRWKGMLPAQLEEIRTIQDKQRLEKDRLAQEDKLRDQEFAERAIAQDRAATLLERQAARRSAENRRQLRDQNIQLAGEQTATKDYIEKQVYTNPPTAAYFMQFNTSSR